MKKRIGLYRVRNRDHGYPAFLARFKADIGFSDSCDPLTCYMDIMVTNNRVCNAIVATTGYLRQAASGPLWGPLYEPGAAHQRMPPRGELEAEHMLTSTGIAALMVGYEWGWDYC